MGSRDVIHLLSYRHATHLDWCDTDGDQAPQPLLRNIPITFAADKQPVRIWVATPDDRQGAEQVTDFEYSGGQVSMTLPAIQYWTMIVIEY